MPEPRRAPAGVPAAPAPSSGPAEVPHAAPGAPARAVVRVGRRLTGRISPSSRRQILGLVGAGTARLLLAYGFWPELQRFFTSSVPPRPRVVRTVPAPSIPLPPVVLPPEIPSIPNVELPKEIAIAPVVPTPPEWMKHGRGPGGSPGFDPAPRWPAAPDGAVSSYRAVDRRVKPAWSPPADTPAGQETVAVVDVGRDGWVTGAAVEQPSGDAAYDAAALAAITRAAPVPPLPDEVADAPLRMRLRFPIAD